MFDDLRELATAVPLVNVGRDILLSEVHVALHTMIFRDLLHGFKPGWNNSVPRGKQDALVDKSLTPSDSQFLSSRSFIL